MRRSYSLSLLVLFVSAGACARGAAIQTVQGDCGDVHGAQVCSWATMAGTEVTEFGVTIPMAAVDQAPEHGEMHWPPLVTAVIGLPRAARDATGFQTLTVYWEPHGHPPGPYMYPHFDFHFYHVDEQTRLGIDCADERKPERLPAGYVLPDEEIPEMGMTLVGICVPEMGMHSLLEEEFYGEEAFTGTMVIGYYATRPLFVEPMITQELLQRRESFDLPIPALDSAPGVRYPTQFRAVYDGEADSYRFVFSRF